jgi:hypothetical protein
MGGQRVCEDTRRHKRNFVTVKIRKSTKFFDFVLINIMYSKADSTKDRKRITLRNKKKL